MANVYIEARPKGQPEGSGITDYVVEDHVDRVLKTFETQEEAIAWANRQHHRPLVARARHLNDKKNPEHWRHITLTVATAERSGPRAPRSLQDPSRRVDGGVRRGDP